jgi:hypothetical protein
MSEPDEIAPVNRGLTFPHCAAVEIVYREKLVHLNYRPIVRTTRKRARPLII